ncbi:MAG: carboxypeptidase-like regulatory domain-containing protein [Planctomycetota bacterium]
MERRALSRPGRAAALLAGCIAFAASPLTAQQTAAEPHLVRGTVLDENGAPLAGAAIGVFVASAELDTAALLKAPLAVSDADGNYQLDVGGAGAWPSLLIAARDRQAVAIRLGSRPASGEQRVVEVVLVPGVQLIGRVRGPDGAALAGAHVSVEGALRTSSVGALSVRSGAFVNARGIFVVPCLPSSGLRVTIRCAGYVGCTMLAAKESPLDVTLQPAAVVRGRVVDVAGDPVADAPVRSVFVASPPPMSPCRTDADGRFSLDVPPDLLLRVKVSVDGRTYVSQLLRGAHDDVVLREAEPETVEDRKVKLVVRDAASGETLPKVHVSRLMFGASNPVTTLFHRHDTGEDYAGDAEVPLQSSTRCLLVEAPGHGFELVDLDDDSKPLEVSLGPEAVITGVVTDADTGKPLAGAHVRALPKGNSSGSGGTLEGIAPVSDAQGRYRIEGLRPGEYSVQVHAADRVASQPETVDLTEQREATLALAAQAPIWLDVVAEGELAAGPPPQLRGDSLRWEGGGNGFFQHRTTPPVPMVVRTAGTTRFGPVAGLRGDLQVWMPSRLRCDAGSALQLPVSDDGVRLDLTQLRSVVVSGRVEVADLPTARLAVTAERVDVQRDLHAARAGLEAGGQFHLDLLPGSYRLALLDLETGMEIFSEARELAVGAETKAPVLKPELHWLSVQLESEPANGELAVQTLRVSVQDEAGARSSASRAGSVPVVPGQRTLRLLVPPGTATIAASRAAAKLGRNPRSYQYETVVEQDVRVAGPETTVTLKVPALPSDEELRKAHG